MRAPSRQLVPLAVALTLTSPTWANPFDPGTPGYKRHIYVDNTASCKQSSTCGAQSNPYRNLNEAINNIAPGDEIIVAGHPGRPYYYYDDGIQPLSVRTSTIPRAGRAVLNFGAKLASASSEGYKNTIIRAWVGPGLGKPVIRGTTAFNDWGAQLNTSTTKFLYARTWNLRKDDNDAVVEPQQVFRNSLPAGQQKLTQRGGQVFGGYYPGAVTADPQLQAALSMDDDNNLWTGYNTPPADPQDMSPNQFYYDRPHNKLYVMLGSPLNSGERLEVGTEHYLAVAEPVGGSQPPYNYPFVTNLILKNLVFERSNTSAYSRGGAVLLNGDYLTLDGIVAQDGDSVCVQVSGHHNKVTNSVFQGCGQIGLVANGTDHTISGNYFTNNNTRGFDINWEAGATKFIGITDRTSGLKNSTISNNIVVNNAGHGLWFDTYADGNTINSNVSAYNSIGLFMEDSSLATITNNTIFGNRVQGIQFRGSPSSKVQGNVLVGNRLDGIFMQPAFDANGKALNSPGYDSKNIDISGNTIAWHDEKWTDTQQDMNWKPVYVTPSTTLKNNHYCGSGAGGGNSLHFWLQDWKATSDYPYNSFDWYTGQTPGGKSVGWRVAKQGLNMTAPAYDTADTGSTMNIVALPTAVKAWQTTPDLALVPINPTSGNAARDPIDASATYAKLKNYVIGLCGQ